jgi:hypothetical protein
LAERDLGLLDLVGLVAQRELEDEVLALGVDKEQ